jgi:hypothetical protein|tara:strand:+ start:7337 stop:7723 length:387 start_codon:yes stop_codon:yes gene_type:complete
MADDYLKLMVRALYSKNSDYSSPKVDYNPTATALRPDEYYHVEINCDTNGETITTDLFRDGATLLIVKNNSTTINVLATFATTGGTLTDMSIPAGSIMVMPDFNQSGNVSLKSASGTATECEVLIIGT